MIVEEEDHSDVNIRRKEHETLEKCQWLRENPDKMSKVKAKVVSVVIGTLGTVTPKLGNRPKQIQGTTGHQGSLFRRVQSLEALRYCAGPSNSQASSKGPKFDVKKRKEEYCRGREGNFILYTHAHVCCICIIFSLTLRTQLAYSVNSVLCHVPVPILLSRY